MADRIIAGQPNGLGQPSGLSQPFILWDSRSWTGALGVGTAGLPNEGTAGSFFDLDVTERVIGDGYLAYFAKQGVTLNSAEWVLTAFDWDDIGGPPCDGAITMMVAVADFPRRRTSGVFTGWPSAAAVVNFFIRRPDNQVHWVEDFTMFNNDDGDANGYHQAYTNNDSGGAPFAQWNIDSNPGDDLAVRTRLMTIVHDVADEGGSYWRGDVPIAPEIDFGPADPAPLGPDTFQLWDQEGPCDAGTAASSPSIATHQQFCFFGEHRGYAPLVPGQPWNGVIGAAFFRGEPTAADRAYWESYFLAGYVPEATPLAYTGGSQIRVDSTYVYHICRGDRTLTPIPGNNPGTVDVFVVGGGGRGEDRGGTLPNGGGAAGEAFEFLAQTAPVGNITVQVGAGGGVLVGVPQPGEDSVFDVGGLDLTAGGGGAPVNGVGGSNGSFSGGAISGPVIAGGGGAGSTGNGGDASPGISGDGGPGIVNDWEFGTNKTYARGGGGGGRAPFADPDLICGFRPPFDSNSGNGGNAHCEINSDGSGTSGIVIMRYLRQD